MLLSIYKTEGFFVCFCYRNVFREVSINKILKRYINSQKDIIPFTSTVLFNQDELSLQNGWLAMGIKCSFQNSHCFSTFPCVNFVSLWFLIQLMCIQ